MEYSRLVEVYEYLEKTGARLLKTNAVAKLLQKTDIKLLSDVTLLLQGRIFPAWSEREIGIASQLMIKTIATATGFSSKEITSRFSKIGDLGLVVEELVTKKKQKTLFKKPLTVEKVMENLQKLAYTEGKGSQERKAHLVSELISSSGPKEAKYIVRTTLGDLRVGVAEGVVRDAIVMAFFAKGKELKELKDETKTVEWAWFLTSDYGEVAKIAKEDGLKVLEKVKLELGKPYHVLLAEKSPSLTEALESFEKPVLEYKYDGARICAHIDGDKIWLYTRRLENVTKQFPDLTKLVKKHVKAKKCIIEGEMLGIDARTGKPLPFQALSQRIQRKYDIERLVNEIPIQINLFDIVYLDGKMLFNETLENRRKILEKIIKPLEGKFQLAKQLVTKDLKAAEKFYKEALEANQEGVIVKNLEAKYHPGRRVAGGWLKVKPTLETLDLAIIGAIWGTGKRAGWLGSYILGCKDSETGEFLQCGMMGTGVKEKKTNSEDITLLELTEMLKPYITQDTKGEVKIKPKIVIEVAYEEIQKSPNYSSGFALRFPRFIRLRSDKGPEDADDLNRIKRIYKMQKGERG